MYDLGLLKAVGEAVFEVLEGLLEAVLKRLLEAIWKGCWEAVSAMAEENTARAAEGNAARFRPSPLPGHVKPNAPNQDIAWDWNSLKDINNRKQATCDFCGKITTGGITRAKRHQMGVRGDCGSCHKCPEDVKETLKAAFINKKNERDAYLKETNDLDEDHELVEEISAIRHGKKAASMATSIASSQTASTAKKPRGPLDLRPSSDSMIYDLVWYSGLRQWKLGVGEGSVEVAHVARVTMSLACLVCHSVDSPSPSHSFRSYSVSSSENEGRCHAVATCLTRKLSLPPITVHSFLPPSSSSKVTPQPTVSGSNLIPGTPRLVRSHAVTRDRVRDWNFDEIVTES
ncbi:hypothetical protein RJT34_26584 [Clitoria ternatea]|uniref:BED-type domain-containing protein n=1 Tax=Clitoria ternatea TaxID=43366 RepID=A0AAN9FFP8_CLITE